MQRSIPVLQRAARLGFPAMSGARKRAESETQMCERRTSLESLDSSVKQQEGSNSRCKTAGRKQQQRLRLIDRLMEGCYSCKRQIWASMRRDARAWRVLTAPCRRRRRRQHPWPWGAAAGLPTHPLRPATRVSSAGGRVGGREGGQVRSGQGRRRCWPAALPSSTP